MNSEKEVTRLNIIDTLHDAIDDLGRGGLLDLYNQLTGGDYDDADVDWEN